MPENVLVCIDTPTEYHQKIISAITAWDESIGIWKHLIPTTNLNICDISITEVPEEQETDSRIVARAFMSNNKIHLYKGRYTKDTTGIVLHEIGHLLGAIHMEETLMAPIIVYNKYTCPDTATLAQVAISNGIDPLLFKTCASNKN